MTEVTKSIPHQIDPVLIEKIKCFPQSNFTTSDGRTFGLFFCGAVTLMRLELKGVLADYRDKAGLEQLKHMAGFILETSGEHNTPQIYDKPKDLLSAWERLVQLTPKERIAKAWKATLFKCKQEHLSRRMRAAASMAAMIPVTAITLMLFHFGFTRGAFANEFFAAVVYAIWVSLGEDFGRPEIDEEESDLDF